MSNAIEDVISERTRQIESEGWDEAHDDEHVNGEMAQAAACYASPVSIYTHDKLYEDGVTGEISIRGAWPWADEWWKPKTRRRDLVRAAALIIAEIERLDRKEQ